MPAYATDASAACDLCACIAEPVTLMPGERTKLPTGIAIAPERSDLVALVFSRSGMGVKHGITLSNSVGVIDADYRGEIIVSVVNHGSEAYTVQPCDRIAQMMFVPYIRRLLFRRRSLTIPNAARAASARRAGDAYEHEKCSLYGFSYLCGCCSRLVRGKRYRLRARAVVARIRAQPRYYRAARAESRGHFAYLCTDL